MALSAGDKLGPYEILASIGAGGMGEVFRAHDARLRRDVAIKVSAERFSDRFTIEARAIAALNHPNVCTLYDVGPNYLVMELVEGETLAERIRQGAIPLDEALRIARQIAEALDAAHEKGVVHRDLKPGNIKITPDGSVKVLDFGLAKSIELTSGDPQMSPTMTASPTRMGMILGTAAYMAPEQARGKSVDKRADIWAFGVVLCEMLTGKRPFQGEDLAETLASVMKDTPDLSSVPSPARRLVEKCLEKDPRKRLRDIGDASFAIDDALAGLLVADGAGTRPGPPPTRSRSPWLIWTAGAVLAIAAGVGIWKLSASLATPAPKVLRLAVSIPASQGFVDTAGNAVLVTPDGSAIVYSGRGHHYNQLFYRRLDQLEGTPLPGTDDSCCLAISPSGDWVAFESNSSVSKVPVHGGTPIKLAPVKYEGGLSWGPDDSIYSSEGAAGLFRIPASGGPEQRIAVPDAAKDNSLSWFMPMAVPDGKAVLTESWRRQRGSKIVSVRIADGAVTELQGEGENPIGVTGGYLFFGRLDGTLGVVPFDPARDPSLQGVIPVLDTPYHRNSGVEASISSAGDLVYVKAADRSQITFLDALGHITGGIPDEHPFGDRGPRISPDGREIVVEELTDNVRRRDLWLYDVATGTRQPLAAGVNADQAEWTPDGRRVVCIIHPETGPPEAWWIPADRSAPGERLVAMPIPIRQIVLSPDSRYAVVTAMAPKTSYDLYLVDLKGDRKPQPLEQSAFSEYQPRISPDGHWLAYVSDESGHDEVYVRPFPGGGAHVQVSADGGDDPRWEKDSGGIVYRNAEQFMRARLAVGHNMAVAQRELLFAGPYTGYDLLPNGSYVALRPGSADAEIVVVTNWLAELKAKLGKK
jgi:predicted Ser/Thr protein kinase